MNHSNNDLIVPNCRVSDCTLAGKYPVPAPWFCVADLNNVLIVLNSSLNFYIYCLAGKRFRAELRFYMRSLVVRLARLVRHQAVRV